MPNNPPQQPPRVQVHVGDAKRDSALGVFQNVYEAGQLDIEEFNKRQQSCLEARYVDDLPVLVADLPGGTRWTQAVPSPARVSAAPVVARDAKVVNALALMSGKVIRLDPGMPSANSLVLWGGNETRTEAVMGSGAEIELTLSSIMGGHTVYVSSGIQVIGQSVSIMAGVSITEEADGDGSNGTLVIKGFNFWDDTSVMLRDPEK